MSKSWLSSKVEVRVSELGEDQLVAKANIKADEQITRRGDTRVLMLTNGEFAEFAKTAENYDALSMAGGFKKVRVSAADDVTGLAGKSKDPNAYDDGDGLLALRNITVGEQITVL